MFPLHFQQVHLLGKGGHRVKIRSVQNPLDVLQRELQLPENRIDCIRFSAASSYSR